MLYCSTFRKRVVAFHQLQAVDDKLHHSEEATDIHTVGLYQSFCSIHEDTVSVLEAFARFPALCILASDGSREEHVLDAQQLFNRQRAFYHASDYQVHKVACTVRTDGCTSIRVVTACLALKASEECCHQRHKAFRKGYLSPGNVITYLGKVFVDGLLVNVFLIDDDVCQR